MTENSVITITRRIKTCKASSGAAAALPPITQIAFGSGGVDSEGLPIPPSEQQIALTHEVARYPVESVTYPEETTARYSATIPKEDLTNECINEAALIDSGGDAAAIKTFYTKQKDKGTAFSFVFDDKF